MQADKTHHVSRIHIMVGIMLSWDCFCHYYNKAVSPHYLADPAPMVGMVPLLGDMSAYSGRGDVGHGW